MRKFLIRFFEISAIIVVLTLFLECLLLTQENVYSYKSNYVKTHADEIKCLLLGNSHIEEGLIPDSMGIGVFNLAINGRSLVYDVALAQKHLPSMHNLEVLIVPYDYFEFYLGRSKDKASKAQKDVWSTIKCMNYKYMGLRVDKFWYWSEFLTSKESLMSRFYKSKEDLINCDSLGFVPLELSNRRFDWKQKALPSELDLTKEKDPELCKKLNDKYITLAELTKDYHVRLVLLSTPVYKTYQEKMSVQLID